MSNTAANCPAEWAFRPLEELASQITSGGTPTSGSPRYYVEYGGLPFAKTEDLTRAPSKFVEHCELAISGAALKETAAKRYPAGTIFISMYGTIGLTKIAMHEMAANQALCALIPPLSCDPHYLYHHLDYVRPQWLKYSGQTTQANINGTIVRAHQVPLPGEQEQRKIAQILDTLDTAIQHAEAIVAKLKAVKQGLLHDLLTRGIDSNGEMRPPQSEAPHLYKESRLGWIPKEWEPRGILDVALNDRQCILTGPFGADLSQADFQTDGVPVLRIGNVQAGYIDWSDTQFVTPRKAKILGKYRVQEGDLLFARQGATTGRNALADGLADGALINYHIIRVAVDKAKCLPVYLHAAFNSEAAKSQVDQAKGRGTREGINSEQIASLCFALPEPHEQKEAVSRMVSIDSRISCELRMLEKLRLQKAGLMEDLLTGRVRVTPLLAQSA